MRILLLTTCLVLAASAEEVRLLDLDPNEASQLIESKDQSLKYAPKIESNVPAVRVLGRDPHNVLEDIYLANQYHGQDGLGGYLYGYSVPDIAKTEKKKAGGDLRGAYNYVNGAGQEIKVQYWDDGTGFHQVDNVPQILPQQIDDTPEVKAAKAEHARLWQEQAERNSHAPADPNANSGGSSYQQYSSQGSTQYPHQAQYQPSTPQYASSPFPQGQQFVASTGAYPSQSQPQNQYQPQGQSQPKPPQSQYQPQSSSQGQYQPPSSSQGQYQPQSSSQGQYQPPSSSQGQYQPPSSYQGQYQPQPSQPSSLNANNVDYAGSYSEQSQTYAAGPRSQQVQARNNDENPEENGPPRGFFYSFDYPVGIITQDQGKLLQKREDINDLYEKKKAALDQQLKQHGDYRVRRSVVYYV